MSDDEHLSSSDQPDFSASEEDEWLPEKETGKRKANSFERDDSSDDLIEEKKPKRR